MLVLELDLHSSWIVAWLLVKLHVTASASPAAVGSVASGGCVAGPAGLVGSEGQGHLSGTSWICGSGKQESNMIF